MNKSKITVVDRVGEHHDIIWQSDQSLMEAIRDNDLPVLAACGGSASCATCHVYLDPKIVQQLDPRSEDEQELVSDTESFREDQSRLSCQIGYDETLSGLILTLAPEE
ncbi:ferredoxin [Rhodococcus sp. WS4]|nr:ferredoxin [Rhodococcus sp. WS4]